VGNESLQFSGRRKQSSHRQKRQHAKSQTAIHKQSGKGEGVCGMPHLARLARKKVRRRGEEDSISKKIGHCAQQRRNSSGRKKVREFHAGSGGWGGAFFFVGGLGLGS